MATYSFSPPTILVDPVGGGNKLMRRVKMPRGVSLVLRDGVYVEKHILVYERDVSGKTEGVDYFRGGYTYRGISQAVADVLIASGFSPVLEPGSEPEPPQLRGFYSSTYSSTF